MAQTLSTQFGVPFDVVQTTPQAPQLFTSWVMSVQPPSQAVDPVVQGGGA